MNRALTRNSYIDFLKIIATTAVVLLHIVSAALSTAVVAISPNNEIIYRTLHVSMNWAVPVFVMISGALFLGNNEEYTFITMFKYVRRLLCVLLSFGWFFSFLELVFEAKKILPSQLFWALLHVLTGNTWAHMWYLYMLIGLYLVTPIIKPFITSAKNKNGFLEQSLLILFLFSSVLPTVCALLGVNSAFSLPFVSPYLFYYLAGYYASTVKITPLHIRFFVFLTIFSSLFIIAINIALAYGLAESFNSLNSYSSSVVAAMALGIFGLIRTKIGSLSERKTNILKILSTLTFGIYIVHPLYINFAYKYLKFSPLHFPAWASIPLFTFIVLILSTISVLLMRKVPFVRKYFL